MSGQIPTAALPSTTRSSSSSSNEHLYAEMLKNCCSSDRLCICVFAYLCRVFACNTPKYGNRWCLHPNGHLMMMMTICFTEATETVRRYPLPGQSVAREYKYTITKIKYT